MVVITSRTKEVNRMLWITLRTTHSFPAKGSAAVVIMSEWWPIIDHSEQIYFMVER